MSWKPGMIQIASEKTENNITHFTIIIYNTPAGLSKKEEDVLEYFVSELGLDVESIPEMILSLYPEYSLNEGQDKMSYDFKYLKCDESDFDDFQNPEMDEKTQQAYDDLWWEYIDFLKYGK